jgi:hypothetical protein
MKTASSGASSGLLGAETASPQRSSLLSDDDSRGQVASSPPPPPAHKDQTEGIAELKAALEALVAMDAFVVEAPASGHDRLHSGATAARAKPTLRHGAPQVTFDGAHEEGEDDDEDDDDEDKNFISPQAPQVTPRRSQFQLAQDAMSNDESEAFYAMAARAVNMSESSAPQALARAAAAHTKGDKRRYADLIHIATILEAVHSGDDRAAA